MTGHVRARALTIAVSALLLAQAAYVAPPASAADPSGSSSPSVAPAPSVSPDPSSAASPSVTPSPVPPASAAPSATPAPSAALAPTATPDPATGLKPGATEVVGARTEYSQTFDNHDGTKTTQFFTDPVFYKPAGSSLFQPIAVNFAPSAAKGTDYVSAQAPVAVAVADSGPMSDFLSLAFGGQTVGFSLPAAVAKTATPVKPTVSGPVADYANLMPGVDLRVIANAHGAKSFFVWRAAPADPTLRYVVDAAGLTLVPQADGSIALVDSKGTTVAAIPRPYAVDSTPDAFAGGGRYTDAVQLSLDPDGKTVTVSVDPTWLKTAVYPVYVDPSTGWVYNAGSNSYGDAHTASNYPGDNFDDYQRPDSPYYHELWNGTDPSGTSGTSYDFLKWDLSSLSGTSIESATLALVPYHQYYNSPTTETTYARRVTSSWTESSLTWNNQPTYTTTNTANGGCVEGNWCTWDVRAIVQLWSNTSTSHSGNYGFQIDTIGRGSTYWKRFIASENGGTTRPKLSVTYHTFSVTSTTPTYGTAISWKFTDAGADAQADYAVDIATTSAFSTIVGSSGTVASSATSWHIVPNASAPTMSDGMQYWYRIKAYDGHAWTDYATGTFTYDALGLGEEPYYTRVPFDLGGGWTLDVGVHNGEARLARSLFSIPSFGPSQAIDLTYSSLDTATAGPFGYGWSSNLTQTLTVNATTGVALWKRADGGRVGFTGSDATGWIVGAGHFETLTKSGTEYTITEPDQTASVFDATSGKLKRLANRYGKTLAIIWAGSTVTATDASGRVTTLTLTGSLVTSVVDSAGRSWTFVYASSNLTSVTTPDPDGAGALAAATTTFGYASGTHRITTLSRSRRRIVGVAETIVWTVGYDAASGKVTSVIDPIAHASYADIANAFTYGTGTTTVALRKTYSGTCSGSTCNTSTYAFDSFGRVTSTTDPTGATTTQAWDDAFNLASVTVPAVNPDTGAATTATTTYAYDHDSSGRETANVIATTTPVKPGVFATTTSTWNPTNDLTSEVDAVGTETDSTYIGGDLTSTTLDPTGLDEVSTYTYDANGQLDTEWDSYGVATKHVHDAAGNETATIASCTSSGTTPPARGVSCTGAGTASATTNVVTSRTFDAVGNILTETVDPTVPGVHTGANLVTTFTYDTLSNQLTEVRAGDPAGAPDATIVALTSTTAYDELGNVLTKDQSWPALAVGGTTIAPAGSRPQVTHTYDLLNHETASAQTEAPAASYAFDAAGDETTTAEGGVTTTRTFDGDGGVLTETVGGTATTTTAFDAAGNVASVSGPTNSLTTGLLTTRTYDYLGDVVKEQVDPAGRNLTTTSSFDNLGRVTSTTAAVGVTTGTTYDRAGRTLSTTAGGVATVTSYTADGSSHLPMVATSVPGGSPTGAGAVTTAFTALGSVGTASVNTGAGPAQTVKYFQDGAGNELANVDPSGIVTRTWYNARGLPYKVVVNCTTSGTTPPTTDPMSCTGGGTRDGTTNLTTLTWYEGTGAAIRTTTDAGVSSATTATTDTAYDALGRTQATRDALGTVTRTTYASATGKVATVVVNCVDASPPANWWDCTGTATANGTRNLVTSYAYDARGNTVTAIVPNGRRTTTSYDLADRVIKVVDNDVATPMLPSDDVTTETAYDAAGRQIASKSPTADGSSSVVTTTTYDPNGHLASTIANCTVSGTTPPGDPAWRTCGQGGITGTADRVTNVVTTYGYDTRGNQVAVTAPDPSAGADALTTATTRSAYDTEGQLCRVLAAANVDLQGLTDPCTTPVAGTTTTNLSTLYGYDAVGNLSSMVDSDGNTTTYLFDATTGLPTGTTDGTNHATSIAYDPLGRKATETDRAGHAVTYAYDAAGRVLTRTAGGATTAYAYDLAGNRLAASAGSPVVTISTAYDALGRPLSVSTSGDAAATTTYSYSLTSPSWTDPTGTYTASLDAFNRQVSLDDSVTTGVSATAYRADGQVASVTRPGSPPIPTTYTYDAAGRPTGSATGVVASFSYVLNRADTRLSEAATVTGDANNGTAYFAYDRLGRLTSYTPPGGAPVPFGWDKVPNRTSAYGVTTTFDAANRPTGTGWSADLDGRIGTIPSPPEPSAVTGITYDALGRLTGATMGGVATTYTYDALDRLSTVTRGGTATERFRYVGQTTAVAQILNGAGVVVKNIANDWAGARFADWLTGTSDLRFFGTNGHGDTVYTLNAGGSVTERNRLDPWGVPLSAPSGTFPEFRFQGSWYDAGTDLAWAIARWYAPRLGTFTSEDSVVGSPADPPSRHLYAFGEGDPVGRVDTGGQFWYRTVKSGKTLPSIADKYLPGTWGAWPMIVNANRSNGRIPSNFKVPKGTCLWIPLAWIAWGVDHHKNLGCDYGTSPFSYQRATKQNKEWWVPDASETLYLWKSGGFLNLTRELLYAKTAKIANRPRIIFQPESGSSDMDVFDWIAKAWIKSYGGTIHRFHDPGAIFSPLPNVRLVYGNSVWPSAFRPAFAFTMGYYMFIDRHKFPKAIPTWLVSHEYVHVLEYEGKGLGILDYMFDPNRGSPKQEYEAIAYLWQGWTKAYGEASYDAFEPPAP